MRASTRLVFLIGSMRMSRRGSTSPSLRWMLHGVRLTKLDAGLLPSSISPRKGIQYLPHRSFLTFNPRHVVQDLQTNLNSTQDPGLNGVPHSVDVVSKMLTLP